MTAPVALLACPWCDGMVELAELESGDVYVYCPNKNCNIGPTSALHVSQDEAIAAWNTRPAQPAASEVVEGRDEEEVKCALPGFGLIEPLAKFQTIRKTMNTPVQNEESVMRALAARIAANAHPEEDSRLEVAYAIARHLNLEGWPCAYETITVSLAAIPAERPLTYSDGPMECPTDSDEWRDHGYDLGWNACRNALKSAIGRGSNAAQELVDACQPFLFADGTSPWRRDRLASALQAFPPPTAKARFPGAKKKDTSK